MIRLLVLSAFVTTFVVVTNYQSTPLSVQQQPTFLSTVQNLLADLGFKATNFAECVQITQKEWLRKPGQERWQIENTQEDKRALVMPYMSALGCVEERFPLRQEYDYAFILGATLASMRYRLAYLQSCWDRGVRFKQIVYLVGERSLDKEKELAVLEKEGVSQDKLPATEVDMAHHLIKTMQSTGGMEHVPVVVVATSGTIAPNGSYKRPTTADTVNSWVATNPQSGSILAISNQPYCVYQQVVLRSLLPEEFFVETVGAQAANSVTTAVYLDTVARVLYQTHTSGYTNIEPLLS